jgi:hypothetical protein
MAVELILNKNNPSVWIYGIFKLPHLRKTQTTRRVILWEIFLRYFLLSHRVYRMKDTFQAAFQV